MTTRNSHTLKYLIELKCQFAMIYIYNVLVYSEANSQQRKSNRIFLWQKHWNDPGYVKVIKWKY